MGLTDETPVLLCVANLKPVKNHALLLRASAILARRGVAHRLWLVGDGPEREPLQALARELGLESTVVFAGHDVDPVLKYVAADLFVLASRWEGMPNAVLEAMAAGLPVVAPAVGDIADLLVDNVTGKIVVPGDAESLASAAAELLAGARRTRYAAASRARAAAFDADVAAARYAELFRWAALGRSGTMPFRFTGRSQTAAPGS